MTKPALALTPTSTFALNLALTLALASFATALFSTTVIAQDISAVDKQNVRLLRADALSALQDGDRKAAIAAADSMIKIDPDTARTTRQAADIYLRAGKAKWATRLFDRYLESEPDAKPELWQRGIALYLTKDYKTAAEQFELHQKVNPNDVENAAWHFLCVAKNESFEKAQENILPAPGDPRKPMKELLEMLKTGDTDAVNESVNATKVDSAERETAAFYSDFYIGLYADAQDEQKKASRLMRRAAEDAPRNYMGDIARVYADFLKDQL